MEFRMPDVSVAPDYGIVAEGAVEDIVATVAPERIVPGAGVNPVRPVGAADHDVIVAQKPQPASMVGRHQWISGSVDRIG